MDASSDDRANRWAFLESWLTPLDGRLSVFSPETMGADLCQDLTLVVELPWDGPTPTILPGIRDALVLLALAKRVDKWAWEDVLPAFCGVEEWRVDYSNPDRYPSFKVSLEGYEWDDRDLDRAVEMIRSFFAGTLSPNGHVFTAAVKKIASIGGVDLTGSSMDIPVTLGVESFGVKRWWPVMQGLREIYGGRRVPVTEVASEVGLDCAFVFGPIDLDVIAGKVDQDMLTLAEDIVAKNTGMGFSAVSISPQFEDEHDPTPEEIRLLGSVVECVLCASRCSTEERAVKGLVTIGHHKPDVGHARVCSALANTQTANLVEVMLSWSGTEPATRAWIWKWVVFALFSDYAMRRSSITGVKLSMELMTEADVDAIAEVLSSPEPIGMLIRGDEAGANGGDREIHAPGVLKRGAWIKLLPMDTREELPPESCSWTLSHDIHGVDVVDSVTSSPDHVRAIVPGYGLCQVRRVDVVPDIDAPRLSGPVTSLELAFDSGAVVDGGPERFLELVGASLTRLVIWSWSEETFPIAAIVRCCPKLKYLRVDGGILNTDAFLEAYRNSDMRVEEITCQVDVDSVPVLAAELSDSETRLAKTLKRLDCRWMEVTPLPDPIELDRIANMLGCNRTLEYVQVRFFDDVYGATSIKELERFDRELLPFASEPFPLRCRLAFLSIFSPHPRADRDVRRRTERSEVIKLASLAMDRLVLALIFEFAAPNAVRRVHAKTFY